MVVLIGPAPVPVWRPREPLQILESLSSESIVATLWENVFACASFLPSPTMSTTSRPVVRRIPGHNAIELIPRPIVKRNHVRVHKGLGQVYRSPKRKRSQAHHGVVVMCPLKAARRKALEDKFRRLKENGPGNLNPEVDALQSSADTFSDGPMDLNEDYVDVEDPQPAQDSSENKRDTKGEAQRLYEAWKKLVPTLVLPFLAYLNKSTCHPTANTFEQDQTCTSCASYTHKTTPVLCLFWDRK